MPGIETLPDKPKTQRVERVLHLMRQLEPGWYRYTDIQQALEALYPSLDGRTAKRKSPEDSVWNALDGSAEVVHGEHGTGLWRLRAWKRVPTGEALVSAAEQVGASLGAPSPAGPARYWWVNQQKFEERRHLKCLWAPLVGAKGQRVYHWESLSEARVGDLVFSYADESIKAVSRVVVNPLPDRYPVGENDELGWKLAVEYTLLDKPVPKPVFIDHPGLPINKRGRANQVYFVPLSDEAGHFLMELTGLEASAKVAQSSSDNALDNRNYRRIESRRAVLLAIHECNWLGRIPFREKYGFRSSRPYFLVHDGREYDSKAILAVANKYAFEGALPLTPDDLNGGKSGAASHLVSLGFAVNEVPKPADAWSLDEVEAIVADYFDMLTKHIKGEAINKAEHNRNLLGRLNNRSRGSVEWKHQNISAMLEAMGLPWLDGYKPRAHTQILLRAVVNDFVHAKPELFDREGPHSSDASSLKLVAPPEPKQVEAVATARRAVKVDFSEREARNRHLGRSGEEWAVEHFRVRLEALGRDDLARQVRWVADELGDGLGYDLQAFDDSGEQIFVEVKTTTGGIGSPFFVTRTELAASTELSDSFVLFRIFDFYGTPSAYELRGPLAQTSKLEAAVWTATPLAKVERETLRTSP